jgi:hypothetical protein
LYRAEHRPQTARVIAVPVAEHDGVKRRYVHTQDRCVEGRHGAMTRVEQYRVFVSFDKNA